MKVFINAFFVVSMKSLLSYTSVNVKYAFSGHCGGFTAEAEPRVLLVAPYRKEGFHGHFKHGSS